MSLILDALRKSEAERRRGQAPSLYADTPAPSTPLRPAWLPWLPVAGGILLLVVVAVYFSRDGDAPVTTAPPADTDAVAATPAAGAPAPAKVPPLPPPPAGRAQAPGAANPASV